MTEFTQVYLRPKIFLLGSSLAFSLKEDPVRCAKVCDESWVILLYILVLDYLESLVESLTLEATPLATQFFKRAHKISHSLQL